MNFYLLSSILLAVCHLARSDEVYATIRTYTCTAVEPTVSCPFDNQYMCNNFCSSLERSTERLKKGDRQCPWAEPPLMCPFNTGLHCVNFCNDPETYKPYDVPLDHYR